MKYAIVAIAKNEEKYMYDWARYHSELGFDGIVICDNNELGSVSQLELVNSMRDIYGTIIFDIRGKDALASAGYQTGVYENMYRYIRDTYPECEWTAFIDIDEYLHFDGMTADEFLSQEKFRNVDEIHINWKCYGDNGHVHYDPRPVMERFTVPLPVDAVYNQDLLPPDICLNNHVKSIVRMNHDSVIAVLPHSFTFADGCKCLNPEGVPVQPDSPFMSVNYNGAHVKHFITKSTEEYIERKIMNLHRADSAVDYKIDRMVEAYFNVNVKTVSKMALIDTAVAKVNNNGGKI